MFGSGFFVALVLALFAAGDVLFVPDLLAPAAGLVKPGFAFVAGFAALGCLTLLPGLLVAEAACDWLPGLPAVACVLPGFAPATGFF